MMDLKRFRRRNMLALPLAGVLMIGGWAGTQAAAGRVILALLEPKALLVRLARREYQELPARLVLQAHKVPRARPRGPLRQRFSPPIGHSFGRELGPFLSPSVRRESSR